MLLDCAKPVGVPSDAARRSLRSDAGAEGGCASGEKHALALALEKRDGAADFLNRQRETATARSSRADPGAIARARASGAARLPCSAISARQRPAHSSSRTGTGARRRVVGHANTGARAFEKTFGARAVCWTLPPVSGNKRARALTLEPRKLSPRPGQKSSGTPRTGAPAGLGNRAPATGSARQWPIRLPKPSLRQAPARTAHRVFAIGVSGSR